MPRRRDQVHCTPPLAWDSDGEPFQPPADAVAWKVRIYTGTPGRPPVVWTCDGVLFLRMDATMHDLRHAVRDRPGSYRLYPVDRCGWELEPVAVIELLADPNASTRVRHVAEGATHG